MIATDRVFVVVDPDGDWQTSSYGEYRARDVVAHRGSTSRTGPDPSAIHIDGVVTVEGTEFNDQPDHVQERVLEELERKAINSTQNPITLS